MQQGLSIYCVLLISSAFDGYRLSLMLVASAYVLCFCLSQIRGDLVRLGTGVELRLSKFGLVQEWGWRRE